MVEMVEMGKCAAARRNVSERNTTNVAHLHGVRNIEQQCARLRAGAEEHGWASQPWHKRRRGPPEGGTPNEEAVSGGSSGEEGEDLVGGTAGGAGLAELAA